jgi:2-phospho-L-lactate/phosphoenolpyruvate guanylyltransferase
METIAVLPIKTFARAKHRLAEALGTPDRRDLAEAMVADVLDALAHVPELGGVIAVTAEPRAAEAATAAGAEVVHDPDEAGQSAAAARGVEAAIERGAARALLVPGDCPALVPEEVSALLAHDEAVVIVPDRHGAGTNALLLSPPDAIAPSFGEGSFARHAARARARGLAVAEVPSLGLDVDTPQDLAALRAALAIRRGGASRTRALLERLLPAPA